MCVLLLCKPIFLVYFFLPPPQVVLGVVAMPSFSKIKNELLYLYLSGSSSFGNIPYPSTTTTNTKSREHGEPCLTVTTGSTYSSVFFSLHKLLFVFLLIDHGGHISVRRRWLHEIMLRCSFFIYLFLFLSFHLTKQPEWDLYYTMLYITGQESFKGCWLYSRIV